MTMMQTYNAITARTGVNHDPVIRGLAFTLRESCSNQYDSRNPSDIPAGTTVMADFAGDFGMYGIAEIDGVLHKVKIPLNELHKVDFGNFDAQNSAG